MSLSQRMNTYNSFSFSEGDLGNFGFPVVASGGDDEVSSVVGVQVDDGVLRMTSIGGGGRGNGRDDSLLVIREADISLRLEDTRRQIRIV